MADNYLLLGPLRSDMSGNYTCSAENVFGRDQVFYQVIILVSPGPPTLLVPANTMHSLALQWKVISDGGSPITGNKFLAFIVTHVLSDQSYLVNQ